MDVTTKFGRAAYMRGSGDGVVLSWGIFHLTGDVKMGNIELC
jgi:hypothetical protein